MMVVMMIFYYCAHIFFLSLILNLWFFVIYNIFWNNDFTVTIFFIAP